MTTFTHPQFALHKLQGELDAAHTVQYYLCAQDARVHLNSYLGHTVTLSFLGKKNCIACGRSVSKTFQSGYCFPCTRMLAQCDLCLVKPENCHYHLGTCREPEWGQAHCFIKHIVYLANTSGVKVGVTRHTHQPGRWIDQGAVAVLPIFQVDNRLEAGLLEVELAKQVADKTNWRAMLKGDPPTVDLYQKRAILCSDHEARLLAEAKVLEIRYPVLEYPKKIVSLNFDKQSTLTGTLLGIKGQYLLFDIGVLNIRKFSGYQVAVQIGEKDG